MDGILMVYFRTQLAFRQTAEIGQKRPYEL